MEDELYYILTDCGVGGDQQDKIVPRILSLLGENEIVVLDAPDAKHVALLDVRGSDASEVKETAIEQTSGAAFKEMIETQKVCECSMKDSWWNKSMQGTICGSCTGLIIYKPSGS